MKQIVYGEKGDSRLDDKKLTKFLRESGAEKIIMRTTYAGCCWYDVEFAASFAGYTVSRGFYNVWEQRHEFSEAYYFTKEAEVQTNED